MLLLSQAPGGALSARCTAAPNATTVCAASTVNGRCGSVRLKKGQFFKSLNRRNSQFLTLANASSDGGESCPVSTSTSNAPKPLPRQFGDGDGDRDETVFIGEEGVPLEGVIRLEKGTGSSSSSSISLIKNWGKVALLAGGDALSLLAFSAIGRFSHGFPVFDLDTVQTADPFIAGWFLSAYFLGAYTEDGRGDIFGGRDVDNTELNELYSFDTSTNLWTLLSSGEIGPPHRSYHSATADGNRVYVFGGCGVKGRLADLWAFDTTTGEWIRCPDPPNNCLPRGGPGLSASCGKIWVVYGFSGEELDDVHCFDPLTEKWSLVEDSGEKPSPRSVFCTTSIGNHIIIYGGEIDPSDLGHLGAGQFSDQVFSLDTETCVWKKVEVVSDSDVLPGPRGWCAFSGGKLDGKEGVLVYGGNSPTNDRLGDMFFLNPSI